MVVTVAAAVLYCSPEDANVVRELVYRQINTAEILKVRPFLFCKELV